MMAQMRLCLLLGILAVGEALAQPGGFPAEVRVDTARLETMSSTLLVPGTVVSREEARVAAEVAGKLLEVADVGTELRVGDPVARVDDGPLALRVREQAAEIEAREARLEFLRGEERRLERLAQQNNAAANSLDQTRSERRVAESNLAVSRARLAQLEDELARATVRAPFDGVVVERLARAGEHVSPGTEVARLVDPSRLEVIARAPLDYLGVQSLGQTVEMRTRERTVSGRVRVLVAVGDENTHLFETRIDLEGAAFPVGQTVRVELPASAPRDVLAVHRDALVLRSDGAAVFVVDDEGKASRRSVRTGLASGERIEVIGAVDAGDRVVVRGNERLRDGQQVTVLSGAPGNQGSVSGR